MATSTDMPTATLQAHSVVLASCSEVLRSRLSRWGDLDHHLQQQQQQQRQEKQHQEKQQQLLGEGVAPASQGTYGTPATASAACGSGGGGLAPATVGNWGGSAAAPAAAAGTCRPVRQLVMRVEGLLPPEAAAGCGMENDGQGEGQGHREGHGEEPGRGDGACGGGDGTSLALRAAELLVRFMYDNQVGRPCFWAVARGEGKGPAGACRA